jgi:small GTP-binding protein
MMIWDTAGQERFYTIARAYFRNALAVILVFDITDRKSFDCLPRWLRDARAEADPHCTVILIGNKADLSPTRVVSIDEAEDFARTHDLTYVEASALDGTNIDTAFQRAAQDLLRKLATGEVSGTAPTTPGTVKIVETQQAATECPC